jgi:hypothetical protein
MKPEISEFSAERDRALGAALRAALDRSDDADFLAAVLERARSVGVGSSGAVLGRWTRVAVAAATLAALVGGILAGTAGRGGGGGGGRGGEGPSQPFDNAWVTATTGNAAAGALFTAEQAPDASILFASAAVN